MRSLLGIHDLPPNGVLSLYINPTQALLGGRWGEGGVLGLYLNRSSAPPRLRSGVHDFSVPATIAKKLPILVVISNTFAVMTLLGLASASPELKKRACPTVAPQVKPVMTSGHTATVIAKGFKTPREIVFDPLANMLVIKQGGGGLSRITWTDNGGLDMCSSIKTLVNDNTVCASFLRF